MRYSIGEVARLAGSTVKTVRFYSDEGLVPVEGRDPSGHRRYGADALARIGLIRTLRELGIDLGTVRKILDRETGLADVAAAHAEAVAVQLRALRLRHAVLTAAARRSATPEELELMHSLARLSAAERDSLVASFLDSTFTGPVLRGIRTSLTPALPDDPTPDQLDAWVELAELIQDERFRHLMRDVYEEYAASARGHTGPPRRHIVAVIQAATAPALAAGTAPDSPEAAALVDEVLTAYAALLTDPPGDRALRAKLRAHLQAANDPRRERYFTLLARVNGWGDSRHPRRELDWLLSALDAPRRTGAL
ncbi:DNA-binding transcriptional MerR regulator [Actinocorallia herbida]|uniref:DNA-binding transcriptional MerR regulator n=1 Tax=Actinocorallia herbida TaxID=58109 RepID=A0A3N1CZB4_9ACTN|nr:MerR family transcriptional regulator [Actinocorallia herbida]ROO86592.1 DNA-binding transcriptional MerR regulator [Actinocorallia herbida]